MLENEPVQPKKFSQSNWGRTLLIYVHFGEGNIELAFPGPQMSGRLNPHTHELKSFPLIETFVLRALLRGESLASTVCCPVVPFGLTELIIQKCDFQAPKQSLGSLPRAELLETMHFPTVSIRCEWYALKIAFWPLTPACVHSLRALGAKCCRS